MKKSFDDVLRECIAQLETRGGDIEEVLSRYPDQADRLRPHLQVWTALSAVEKAEPAPSGLLRGRQQLFNAIAKADQTKGAAFMTTISGIRGWSIRILAPIIVGAALALGIAFLTGNLGSDSDSTAEALPFDQCILQLDFDGNGQLSVADVALFRDAIKNNDPAFDFNGDGTTDVFDVIAKINQVVDCLQQIQPPPPPLP